MRKCATAAVKRFEAKPARKYSKIEVGSVCGGFVALRGISHYHPIPIYDLRGAVNWCADLRIVDVEEFGRLNDGGVRRVCERRAGTGCDSANVPLPGNEGDFENLETEDQRFGILVSDFRAVAPADCYSNFRSEHGLDGRHIHVHLWCCRLSSPPL